MISKFYTLKELAKLYGCSVATLKKRLEPIKEILNEVGKDDDGIPVVRERSNVWYSPKQVRIIIKTLGDPTKEI